ncbi:hypothetical protein LSAT2_014917 [Lamellibrachia satsuma]|nr:hypothetical protein LSAT2_014917 [Lamellibrachia satsuma]
MHWRQEVFEQLYYGIVECRHSRYFFHNESTRQIRRPSAMKTQTFLAAVFLVAFFAMLMVPMIAEAGMNCEAKCKNSSCKISCENDGCCVCMFGDSMCDCLG